MKWSRRRKYINSRVDAFIEKEGDACSVHSLMKFCEAYDLLGMRDKTYKQKYNLAHSRIKKKHNKVTHEVKAVLDSLMDQVVQNVEDDDDTDELAQMELFFEAVEEEKRALNIKRQRISENEANKEGHGSQDDCGTVDGTNDQEEVAVQDDKEGLDSSTSENEAGNERQDGREILDRYLKYI